MDGRKGVICRVGGYSALATFILNLFSARSLPGLQANMENNQIKVIFAAAAVFHVRASQSLSRFEI
jgi:hypothetical protein